MTMLPPLTGTPLDYVPVDAPNLKKKPTNFTAPIIRRSLVAAITAAAFVAALFFPSIGVGAIALAVMYGFVWAGNKFGDWLNEREAHATSTPASWWPDPFSWVPAILALVFIAAVIYFH